MCDLVLAALVICVLFGGYLNYPFSDKRIAGTSLVVFILIGLLGWGVFGPPIR